MTKASPVQEATIPDLHGESCELAAAPAGGGKVGSPQRSGSTSLWLGSWLERVGLSQYLGAAEAWCESMGAVDLEEVEEYWEELASHLGLQGSEREALARACGREVPAPGRGGGQHDGPSGRKGLQTFGHADDPYTVVKRLGQGATATVYECSRHGKRFAAKVMRLERLRLHPRYEELLALMNREISILWTLRHDKIVQLHDVVESPAELILVMELMEGGELFNYIVTRKRLTADEARHVFAQVVEGLKYIHSKSIIHRDLKPENILIDAAASRPGLPEVKLSDFGHSKPIHDGYTRAVSTVGTGQYWAPEVREGLGSYDERADLWSLGVVLYVMLAGTYPFDSSGPTDQFCFHGSREIDELLHGLIRIRPADRLTLEHVSNHSWVLAKPSSIATHVGTLRATRKDHWPEVRVRLPRAPQDAGSLKADLALYSRKYKAAANLRMLEVIVNFGELCEADVVILARDELADILSRHCQGLLCQAVVDQFNQTLRLVAPEVRPEWAEEYESLVAIYGSEFEALTDVDWVVRIRDNVAFCVHLTAGYPAAEPPSPHIECASDLLPAGLVDELLAQWLPGDVCVCQWAERVRDELVAAGRAQGTNFLALTGTWAQRELADLGPGETKTFPVSLSSFQRLVLHRLADRLGWQHESVDVPDPDGAHAVAYSRPGRHARYAGTVQRAKATRQLSVTRPRKGAPAARNLNIAFEDFVPHEKVPEERRASRTSSTVSATAGPSRTTTQGSLGAGTGAAVTPQIQSAGSSK